MVLFRHDDTAQVIIHTANLISQDWTNLSQAVWRSPMLPLSHVEEIDDSHPAEVGSGRRFKRDLVQYISAYGASRTGQLVHQLKNYNFASIRAALVASVPGRHGASTSSQSGKCRWGWRGLQDVLEQVPYSEPAKSRPVIVAQVSSIASLGVKDTWISSFFGTLGTSSTRPSGPKPSFRIIFPTEDEVRRSLDGYQAGASIHIKISSSTGVKQLRYLRPYLCHWAEKVMAPSADSADIDPIRLAGRRRAAPHVSVTGSLKLKEVGN